MNYNKAHDLGASNTPGYQSLQLRRCILPSASLLFSPLEWHQVSSVVITCKKGQSFNKGGKMSYLQFGGLDIVVLWCLIILIMTAQIRVHYISLAIIYGYVT